MLMLKLKLQYFGHLMRRTDSSEKTLILGKIEGKRKRGWQRMRWLESIIDSVDMNFSKFWETVKDRGVWHAAVHEVAESQTRLNDWKTATISYQYFPNDIYVAYFFTIENNALIYTLTCKFVPIFFFYFLVIKLLVYKVKLWGFHWEKKIKFLMRMYEIIRHLVVHTKWQIFFQTFDTHMVKI